MGNQLSASRFGKCFEVKRPRLSGRLCAGLCLACAAFSGSAAVTDLIAPGAWQFYGSGAVQGGTLTVGDSVGYDPSDGDRDGNPYNVWFGGGTASSQQGVDYDEAVTLAEFSPPFKLTWTGCFPATSKGYNNIFLGRKNTAFTGGANSRQYPITQEFGYTARWDYSGLNTVVLNPGSYDVQKIGAASLSGSKYCGDYRIDWSKDQLDFYFNGTKVRTQQYVFVGPVSILVRSFDLSHTISSMKLEPLVATTRNRRPARAWRRSTAPTSAAPSRTRPAAKSQRSIPATPRSRAMSASPPTPTATCWCTSPGKGRHRAWRFATRLTMT